MNKIVPTLSVILMMVLSLSIYAASIDEGIEYQKISPPVATETGDKIEVLELFWYKCPHCYRFEPYLEKWKKTLPKNVVFRRMPALLNPNWTLQAKAYYTAEILGILDKIHRPMFDAIHRDHINLNTPKALAKFFGKFGVKRKEFFNIFNSFSVDSKIRKAREVGRRYGATGVPTMIVNGEWRTSASLAGGHKEVINVLNHLIKLESRQKGK